MYMTIILRVAKDTGYQVTQHCTCLKCTCFVAHGGRYLIATMKTGQRCFQNSKLFKVKQMLFLTIVFYHSLRENEFEGGL